MNILKKIYCRIFQTCFRIALPVLPYREPELIDGFKHVPEVLKKHHISHILLVTDPGVYKLGLTKPLEKQLSKSQISCTIYKDTVANPTSANIEEAKDLYLAHGCQALLAFGGGSSMDCAKAVGARLARPNKPLAKMEGILKIWHKLPLLIAVPTTAGTGSETTLAAVITDADTHHKYAINDFNLIPDYAVLEPSVTYGLPPQLTATTGMDALTHAIEAYVSTANCDFTDPLALHAIKMIQRDLVDSYNGDMAKRDSMHNAQCLAGMAFSNALLGIVHSMAHKTGAAFADYGAHIIHGAANAMYLPKVIAFNAKDETAKERYGEIADFMKLGGETLDEKVALLIAYLRKMNDDLKIPHCIKNYGADSYPTEQGFVPEEVFLERLPEIAKNAIADACTGSNPRQPSQEEMEKLLKCCYYDTEVDF